MLKRLQAVKSELRADKARGFSLVELIIVVAILAILVAIAIPIFSNIQTQAQTSAAKASASNGAATVAAAVAGGTTDIATISARLTTMSEDGIALTLTAPASGTAVSLDNYCVTATPTSGDAQTSGPGCS